jgi:AcrR family transcriptional regulator
MRSDAVRRRESIVREARRLFAAHGSTVALDVVADAAGVGIATLYRNFATRADLIEVVVLSVLADVRAVAQGALHALPEGGEEKWADFVEALVDLDVGALTEALSPHVGDRLPAEIRETQAEALDDVAAVLDEARARGFVADILSPTELVLAVGILSRPQPDTVALVAPDLGARLVRLLVKAMRPES